MHEPACTGYSPPAQRTCEGTRANEEDASFALGDYQFLDIVGRGGQSAVWRVRSARHGRLFAAKVFHPSPSSQNDHPELCAMRTLAHPGIARCYDALVDGDRLVIIYELCIGGSLQDLVDENPGGLPLPEFCRIAEQLVSALAFVHSRGLYHGDVKATNVLFADAMRRTLRLIDFGMSGTATRRRVRGGTAVYQAPEIWHGHAVDPQAADVWALGVLFCLLAQGRYPWTGDCDEDRGRQIISYDYTLDCCWPRVAEAIRRMLSPEENRVTMHSLQQLPIFAPRCEIRSARPRNLPAHAPGPVAARPAPHSAWNVS